MVDGSRAARCPVLSDDCASSTCKASVPAAVLVAGTGAVRAGKGKGGMQVCFIHVSIAEESMIRTMIAGRNQRGRARDTQAAGKTARKQSFDARKPGNGKA